MPEDYKRDKENEYDDREGRREAREAEERREKLSEDLRQWWAEDVRPLDRAGNLAEDKFIDPISNGVDDWIVRPYNASVEKLKSWGASFNDGIIGLATRLDPRDDVLEFTRWSLEQFGADMGLDPATEQYRRATTDTLRKAEREVERKYENRSTEDIIKEVLGDPDEMERDIEDSLKSFLDNLFGGLNSQFKECIEESAKRELQRARGASYEGISDENIAKEWRYSREEMQVILDYQQQIEGETCLDFYRNYFRRNGLPEMLVEPIARDTANRRAQENRAWKLQNFAIPDVWYYEDIQQWKPTGFKDAIFNRETGEIENLEPTGPPQRYMDESYCPGVAEFALDEYSPNWEEINQERANAPSRKPKGISGHDFVIPAEIDKDEIITDWFVGNPNQPPTKVCTSMRWEQTRALTLDSINKISEILNGSLRTLQEIETGGPNPSSERRGKSNNQNRGPAPPSEREGETLNKDYPQYTEPNGTDYGTSRRPGPSNITR